MAYSSSRLEFLIHDSHNFRFITPKRVTNCGGHLGHWRS